MANEKGKVLYTVPDYMGNPTSVPAENVQAFLARQEELKAKAERGEKIELDAESKAALKTFGQKMREWASQPPESWGMDLEEWLNQNLGG